ncbi:class I SAM-dependent methyltransferase [bacterium BMS3Abin03]|nr:class I SAM-dependent methyltransferase [bacterium BMS3Abin03]MCG6960961.1 class I SAM-dependent methyltransferase [bacterium BMS3Abin03]
MNVTCKICSSESKYVFSATVLQKYDVKYFHCPECGFLQTEEPYWLDEAYSSAIRAEDTGLMKRNYLLAERVSVLIKFFFNKNNKFLDYAGGYGIFVRLMRDIGYNFYWNDPFAKNLLARGFEYNTKDDIELVTAFECFEHFVNPLEELDKIYKISDSILFSTRIFYGKPPKPDEWWYYSLNAGQHISLYSRQTLNYLADRFNLYLNTDNKSFHLFSKKKINNTYFNMLLKLSVMGLSKLTSLNVKSKTDSDFELLSNRKITG